MKVLVFEAQCRPHDLFEKIRLRGANTLKNVDLGYDKVQAHMIALGCDDYSVTYSYQRDDTLRPALKPHPERDHI